MTPVPFVILTITRSGSTWLASLLDAQPGILNYGELFLDQGGPTFIEKHKAATGTPPRFAEIRSTLGPLAPLQLHRYLQRVRAFDPAARAFGFKLMLHPRTLSILAMLALHRYRLICLIRDDVFEGAVSRFVMDMTGEAHGATATAMDRRLHVDPGALVQEIQKRLRGIRGLQLVTKFWPGPALRVRYEDLQDDPHGTLERIAAFLGLPDAMITVCSPLVRRIQQPYAELFANPDEVVAAAERSKLGAYLPASLRQAAPA